MSLSLFRFLEATEGRIFIDDIDISKLDLEVLRSNLTIIPQDPILFTGKWINLFMKFFIIYLKPIDFFSLIFLGTIRSNLDVFSQYTDYEIFESLRRVNLISSSSVVEQDLKSVNIFYNLDMQINEGDSNLSQEQRQLLCLARALLKKSKIIIMNEATVR